MRLLLNDGPHRVFVVMAGLLVGGATGCRGETASTAGDDASDGDAQGDAGDGGQDALPAAQCSKTFACYNSYGILPCDTATHMCAQSGCAGGLGGTSSSCDPLPTTSCGPCPTCACLGLDAGCLEADGGGLTVVFPSPQNSCTP
jgi:hypothetical protein